MKGMIALVLASVMLQFAPAMQWSGWALFAVMVGFYVKLRMSDPQRQFERLMDEHRKVLKSLADEKIRVMELTNRNDALNTNINTLHAEHLELKGQFSQLNVAYGKLGERFDKMQEDLKEEREKRDQQFMQWTREKAQRGDL